MSCPIDAILPNCVSITSTLLPFVYSTICETSYGHGEGVYEQTEAETESFICEVRKTPGLHRTTHVRDEPQSFSEWNVRVVV